MNEQLPEGWAQVNSVDAELPQSWIEATIEEINLHKTQNITPSDFPEEEFELFSVPIFPTGKPENVLGKDVGSSKQVVAPGDVLLCKINPRINRVWTVSEKTNLRQIASSEWINVRNPVICANYLKYAFSKKDFRELLCSEVAGVGGSLTRAQPKKVEKYTVPLAPLNEQIRIADKLDSVLAKVDAAQARLEKIPTLLKRFRQSVLAAATSGELTREWRTENKIEATYTTLGAAGIDVKTGPFGSALHKEEYISGGIPVINPMHIRDGSIYPSTEMTISNDKFRELKAWKLEIGDVVIGRRGEMGRAAEIASGDADLLCGTGSMIIRSNSNLILPAYLCLVLRSPNSIAYFESNSVGSTMVNLNQKIIKSLSFHYPSTEEQKEIFRRVESLFAQADAVEKQYLAAKQRLDRLSQSLLAKAFRGELVPQNPNDEPATELLKRIQAERQTQPPIRRKRSKPA